LGAQEREQVSCPGQKDGSDEEDPMTQNQRIVIVTDTFDLHADAVMIELRKMGHQPVRLHPAQFPTVVSVTLAFDQQGWSGALALPKGILDLADIQSIWWRRPKSHVFAADLSPKEREFARLETEHTFAGLWSILDCYWMSFPPFIRRASNKIEQLQRAAQLGFRVPRTLVTNDPARVQEFYETCGGHMIYKALANPGVLAHMKVPPAPNKIEAGEPEMLEAGEPEMVYTTLITQEHLSLLETVCTAPCQFQEVIPKHLELRVTIIGDDIFVCEIHSQEDERTSLDWRHYEASIPYTKGTLPPEIAEKCFALMKGYGLNYSAMDLILTPEGEYVFLENNPSGQCFFVQDRIPEFKMIEAVAAYLLKGNA
jgi:glutathione synthase/RimK-type ligase-like ATP-grasp enzyme